MAEADIVVMVSTSDIGRGNTILSPCPANIPTQDTRKRGVKSFFSLLFFFVAFFVLLGSESFT